MFLMKIKINLFRKIFLFSIFLIIFTVLTSYILSVSVADSFYVNRKKKEIVEIKNTSKFFINNTELFEEYSDNIKDSKGINIYLRKIQNNKSNHHKKNRYENLKEGFHIISLQNNNVTLLVYKELISKREMLIITTSLSVMSSHRHEVYMLNLITFAIAMIISIFISRFFAKKITDNIGMLNRVAQKISHLDFTEKSEIKTSDELKELSKSINIMAENISSSIDGLNTFVSNASHELKTPIAVINTHAQLLLTEKIADKMERKKYYKVILNESKYMDILVKDLLLISKLSSNFSFQKENFILNDILKTSIEKFEFLELEKDLSWKINLDKIEVFGNKKLIKIVFDNLVQNALKYSPENSEIRIYKENERIVFENPTYINEIQDTEKLFQPFFRGKNATEIKIDGSGLGLSLIKRILDIHKIKHEIKIENGKFLFYFDIFR